MSVTGRYELKLNALIQKPEYLVIGGVAVDIDKSNSGDSLNYSGEFEDAIIFNGFISVSFLASSRPGGEIELKVEVEVDSDSKKLRTYPIKRKERDGYTSIDAPYQIVE